MYHWLYKSGKRVAIFIVIILALTQSLSRCNPYNIAENQISTTLDSNPYVYENLTNYGNTSQEWEEKLEVAVLFAHVIVPAIEGAKQFNLLILVANTPIKQMLVENLDAVARKLIELDSSLENVSKGTAIVSNFNRLQDSTFYLEQEKIVQICQNNADVSMGLTKISTDIQDISNLIRQVTQSEFLHSILDMLKYYRLVNPTEVDEGLAAWQVLPDTIDTIPVQIGNDVSTLNSIQNWCQFAEVSDSMLHRFPLPEATKWVNSRLDIFLAVLIISIAIAIGGWVGTSGLDHARWRGLAHPKVTVAGTDTKKDERNRIIPNPQNARVITEVPAAQSAGFREASLICNWIDGRRETLILPQDGKFTIRCNSTDDLNASASTIISQIIIRRARTSYFLQITDTRSPIKINGQIIAGAKALTNGDVIIIGDVTAVFLNP